MSNATPLAEALDRLSSEKQNKMARVMEVAQLLLTGVLFDREFVAGQAKKHSGVQLRQAMLGVGAWHLDCLKRGATLKDWSTALAKELNGNLEETTEPKPKRSESKEDAVLFLIGMKYARNEVEPLVDAAPSNRPSHETVTTVLKQLGERS